MYNFIINSQKKIAKYIPLILLTEKTYSNNDENLENIINSFKKLEQETGETFAINNKATNILVTDTNTDICSQLSILVENSTICPDKHFWIYCPLHSVPNLLYKNINILSIHVKDLSTKLFMECELLSGPCEISLELYHILETLDYLMNKSNIIIEKSQKLISDGIQRFSSKLFQSNIIASDKYVN
jgi:hypothetical protein